MKRKAKVRRRRDGPPPDISETAVDLSSAPATPAIVTISEMVPMSGINPLRKSHVRVAAMGRKKAR